MADPETNRPSDLPADEEPHLLDGLLALGHTARLARLQDIRTERPTVAQRLERLLDLLDRHGWLEDPEVQPPLPERIGEFRIVELLGRGGMATVYLAEAPDQPAPVALKVLHPGIAWTPRARERFRREAEIATSLDHRHLCSVVAVGESDDVPWIAMRAVEGVTLAACIERSGAASQPVAVLSDDGLDADANRLEDAVFAFVEATARALHFAHTKGLVHRDVKPSNLMVTPSGDPVVLDFGLARNDSEIGFTATGDQLGTPTYMAPEQIASGSATAATDVYALGVVLYECLHLCPPFAAPSREGMFRQILRDDPPITRRYHVGPMRDVGTVLQVALAKNPERRYRTAEALADDLRRLRTGERVSGRRAGPVEKLVRFVALHPAASAALVMLLVTLTISIASLLRVRAALEEASDASRTLQLSASAERAPAMTLGDVLSLHERRPSPSTASLLYEVTAASTEHACLSGHGAMVWRVVFRADGKRLASASDDGTVRVWDVSTAVPSLLNVLRHEGNVQDLDTDGRRLVTAAADGSVRLWDFDGALVARAPIEGIAQGRPKFTRARFSHDSKRIAIGSFTGEVWQWDLQSNVATTLHGHDGLIFHCEYSPQDDLLLSLVGYGGSMAPYGRDLAARLWRQNGTSITLAGHTAPLLCGAFSPDGRHVLTGGEDRTLRLWSTEGIELRVFHGFRAAVRCVAFLPDGRRFAAADLDGTILVHDLDGRLHSSFAHEGGVWSLEISPDGEGLLTGGMDATALVHTFDGRRVASHVGHTDRVMHATSSPDGSFVATASRDRTVRLWRAEDPLFRSAPAHATRPGAICWTSKGTRLLVGEADGSTSAVRGPQLSPGRIESAVCDLESTDDGDGIAAAHADHRFTIWRGDGDPVVVELRDRLGPSRLPAWRNARVAFLDRERLLLGAQDGSIAICSTSGTLQQELSPHEGRSPGSELLDLAVRRAVDCFATSHWNGDVVVRSLDGTVLHREPGPAGEHAANLPLSFSASGQLLACGSTSTEARVHSWNGTALQLQRVLPHEATVVAVQFAPLGTSLATAASDGRLALYAEDGSLLARIRASKKALRACVWSPDASAVATVDADGIVGTWPAAIAVVREAARERQRP